jgi:hypothetical protein
MLSRLIVSNSFLSSVLKSASFLGKEKREKTVFFR